MDKQLRAQVVFHLTGRHAEGEAAAAATKGMRPALMAAYRNLDSLRYDFPVILAGGGDEYVQSLTAATDAALRAIAPPGVTGEALRRRAIRIEAGIRRLAAAGAQGTLAELWDRAVQELAPAGDAAFLHDAGKLRRALAVDGEVADCNAALPARFLRHAWAAVQEQKSNRARERIANLAVRLGNILRADHARSAAALTQPALQASFGAAHHGMFDFEAMSRLLSRGDLRGGLGERRRRRVEEALADLSAQRFFGPPDAAADADVHRFEFSSVAAALAAFGERLPELARLLKALRIAELEVEGGYVEAVHDEYFDAFDEESVTPGDLQFFPDYLVCLEAGDPGAQGTLAEALSSGVPLKVVVHAATCSRNRPWVGAGSPSGCVPRSSRARR